MKFNEIIKKSLTDNVENKKIEERKSQDIYRNILAKSSYKEGRKRNAFGNVAMKIAIAAIVILIPIAISIRVLDITSRSKGANNEASRSGETKTLLAASRVTLSNGSVVIPIKDENLLDSIYTTLGDVILRKDNTMVKSFITEAGIYDNYEANGDILLNIEYDKGINITEFNGSESNSKVDKIVVPIKREAGGYNIIWTNNSEGNLYGYGNIATKGMTNEFLDSLSKYFGNNKSSGIKYDIKERPSDETEKVALQFLKAYSNYDKVSLKNLSSKNNSISEEINSIKISDSDVVSLEIRDFMGVDEEVINYYKNHYKDKFDKIKNSEYKFVKIKVYKTLTEEANKEAQLGTGEYAYQFLLIKENENWKVYDCDWSWGSVNGYKW
ncbi:hypothetical protein [Clostridium sp. 'White wine YQ']|uniref:hypothetical protein n=1 Tax=Clostridium sp. 'White wine YQ' TaxID=3027474 RepID=UPI0023654C5E|nr:hypothetical protein [Clostridium sp. 'White wine YQ']MDD7796402.1 hypothetical protein [Clostridium sp. 'White wine YQ']